MVCCCCVFGEATNPKRKRIEHNAQCTQRPQQNKALGKVPRTPRAERAPEHQQHKLTVMLRRHILLAYREWLLVYHRYAVVLARHSVASANRSILLAYLIGKKDFNLNHHVCAQHRIRWDLQCSPPFPDIVRIAIGCVVSRLCDSFEVRARACVCAIEASALRLIHLRSRKCVQICSPSWGHLNRKHCTHQISSLFFSSLANQRNNIYTTTDMYTNRTQRQQTHTETRKTKYYCSTTTWKSVESV